MSRQNNRNRNPQDPTVQISKSLSYLLRHAALKEGLAIDDGGFIAFDELKNHKRLRSHKITEEQVLNIVKNCAKQRFFAERREDGKLYIRANQGHSIEVHVQMEKVESPEAIPLVIHGTYTKFWDAIKQTGLNKMSRLHVHFTAGELGDGEVISGMRATADIWIYIDAAKAMADGIVFYRSANNVILSEGINGVVPTKYFSRVRNIKTGQDLEVPV